MAATNPFLQKRLSVDDKETPKRGILDAKAKAAKPETDVAFLRQQLKLRSHEFTEQRYVTVYAASLNANGKKPRADIDLSRSVPCFLARLPIALLMRLPFLRSSL